MGVSPPGSGSGRLFTVGLVASWYSSNISVLLLNNYLLSNYGFRYPIFLTMCHMTACSLFSYASVAWLKLVPLQTVRSRLQLLKIAALSLVFCLSVGSGNVSLRFLPVSFNQAVGATTPFFTAVFAYVMTVKRESWITYLTVVPVVTGVIIASGKHIIHLKTLEYSWTETLPQCLWMDYELLKWDYGYGMRNTMSVMEVMMTQGRPTTVICMRQIIDRYQKATNMRIEEYIEEYLPKGKQ